MAKIISICIWLMVHMHASLAIANDIALKNAHHLLVIDSDNKLWEGKYISERGNEVKIKFKEHYSKDKKFKSYVPRDTVAPCVKMKNDEYIFQAIELHNGQSRYYAWKIGFKCSNGWVKLKWAGYLSPDQYSPEVDNIDEIRKGSKIQQPDSDGRIPNRSVKVEHIFKNGMIQYLDRDHLYGYNFIDIKDVKPIREKLVLSDD